MKALNKGFGILPTSSLPSPLLQVLALEPFPTAWGTSLPASIALAYAALGNGPSKDLVGWRDRAQTGSGPEGLLEQHWDCSSHGVSTMGSVRPLLALFVFAAVVLGGT